MSVAALSPPAAWGDRTFLLPKQLQYVLSFDVSAEANGPYLVVNADGTGEPGGLRNMFGDSVVTLPEGLRCDLPIGRVLMGSGEIGAPDDPESSRLALQVVLDVGPSGKVLVDCPGVVVFEGGPEAFRSGHAKTLRGTSFIVTRHETESSTYRWVNRRQLYGVGRVEGERRSGHWSLHFTFDLYAGFRG